MDEYYPLADMYEKGVGTAQNMDKALFWYKAARAQGHDLATKRCEELDVGEDA